MPSVKWSQAWNLLSDAFGKRLASISNDTGRPEILHDSGRKRQLVSGRTVTTSTPLDLIVIGTGAAGLAPALKCARAGWRVAIVDDQPYGGTCALRGCDPKKVLIQAAEVVDWHRRMIGKGITGSAKIDWPSLMRFKRSFTEPVPERRERSLRDAGVTSIHGKARFTARDALSVGGTVLRAEHFVIASGARPATLGIPGEEHLHTSTDFLELDELPQRIAFIGAGYISFELAHLSQRAGAQATILGRGKPLGRFDQDLVKRLADRTSDLGIDLKLKHEVTAIERIGTRYRVHSTTEDGVDAVETDYVVHAAGRVPTIDGLSLEATGVETDERRGVVVNEFLQSVSNAKFYAAGDATLPEGSLPLTPVAGMEGAIVASNLLVGNHRTPNYLGIPSVVFTGPPLASVGLTEIQAMEQGLDARVRSVDTAGWFSNSSVASSYGMSKTVVDAKTDQLLGAHLLGMHAEEVINVFALAVRLGLKSEDLKHMIYAYPTSSSDIPYMLG